MKIKQPVPNSNDSVSTRQENVAENAKRETAIESAETTNIAAAVKRPNQSASMKHESKTSSTNQVAYNADTKRKQAAQASTKSLTSQYSSMSREEVPRHPNVFGSTVPASNTQSGQKKEPVYRSQANMRNSQVPLQYNTYLKDPESTHKKNAEGNTYSAVSKNESATEFDTENLANNKIEKYEDKKYKKSKELGRKKNNDKSDKSRKPIIVGIIIAALVVIIGAVAFFIISSSSNDDWFDSASKSGSYEGKTEEQIIADLNAQVEEGEMNISIASTLLMENGAPGIAVARIENIPANSVDQKVKIVLKDTNETIYESGAIAPGYSITNIEIDKSLEAGTYPATAIFTGYNTETHEAIGKMAAEIKIMVLK